MARTKALLGAGARLSDYLSASLLARVYSADQIHQILDEHGSNSQRVRSFPAVAGVYYCMALSLYPEAAYEEVFAVISQGLAWAR
ncbi:transposase domain-containing protein, partial [Denitromonas iodatirespirans]